MAQPPIVAPLLSQPSGSAGTVTASRNAAAPFYRTRVTPTDPATPLQTSKRRTFRSTVRAWKNFLTQAHRDAWDAYARAYNAHRHYPTRRDYTGRELWLRLNLTRALAGLFYYTNPPPVFDAAWHLPYVVTMTAPSPLVTVTWTGTQPFFGDTWARLFCHNTAAYGSTINSYKPPYRWRATLIPSGTPPYTFGSGQVVNPGDRVFVRLTTQWGDGRLCPHWRVRVVVA